VRDVCAALLQHSDLPPLNHPSSTVAVSAKVLFSVCAPLVSYASPSS
jgi:hypothetical protein